LAILAFRFPGQAQESPQATPSGSTTKQDFSAELRNSDVDTRRFAVKGIFELPEAGRMNHLPQLSEMLKTEKDGQVRLWIFDILVSLGPKAAPAVPALIQSMKAGLGGSRTEKMHQDYRAAIALASIGEPAVNDLQQLLAGADTKPNVRAESIMALGRIGKASEPAIPEILKYLGHSSDRLRQESVTALGLIGAPATPNLIEASREGSIKARSDAIEAIGKSATNDEPAIKAVLDLMSDQAPELRTSAFRAAASMSIPRDRLIPKLRQGLKDDNSEVRQASIRVLIGWPDQLQDFVGELRPVIRAGDAASARLAAFAIAQTGKNAIPALIESFADESSPIEIIAEALVVCGRPAVPELTKSLTDPNPRIRRGAALALGQIRPLAAETPQKLAAITKDPNPEVRISALQALGDLGARAREVVPQIRECLVDQNDAARKKAVEVIFLCSARDDRLVSDFVGKLSDTDPSVQVSALNHLRSLGPLGRRAIPDVTAKLKSSDETVRRSAADMIASHGPVAAEAVPALVALLDDKEPGVQSLAIKTLAKIGKPSQVAFVRLETLMGSNDQDVREAVFRAIGSLGLEAETVRPGLAKGLRDSESKVRLAAMQSVQQLGPQGSILLPDLIRVAENPMEARAVERALRRYERRGPDTRSLPDLIALLSHEKESVQLLALRFLALAKPTSPEVITAIEQLKMSGSEPVRKKAEETLNTLKASPSAEPEGKTAPKPG
jgi:HEAT repeat protein